MIVRTLLSLVLVGIFPISNAVADDEKMPPTIKCSTFLDNFSRAATDFSPHRTVINAIPQKGSSIGMQITNWQELQAAYDCKDGMFTGISATLLDSGLEGKGAFRRFLLSAATALTQPSADVIALEKKASKEAYSEAQVGNYVIYISNDRYQRFSVGLRYK